MCMMTTNISLRMDPELKKQAEELFYDLGLNMSTALTMFLRQAVRSQGIPFEVSRTPNADTMEALEESLRIARDPNAKSYRNLDELFGDLRA
ncbi:MAG: type II toxin-antitoxin system RelB/DinJ family antitoxin [Oscillospiraceae bacterium]|nr:type II toxin-antitoxin system RelB/DinJ family antitoxin [Oscillospiraceae bacterium]